MGDFFASPALLNTYPDWRWADALSFTKYAFVAVAINELKGLEIECDQAPCSSITTGEQIIEINGYETEGLNLGFCIGMLIVLIVGSRGLAYIGLRFLK